MYLSGVKYAEGMSYGGGYVGAPGNSGSLFMSRSLLNDFTDDALTT